MLKPPSAIPLMFVLANERRISEVLYRRLALSFGSIMFKGRPHPFDCTDYYEGEFGKELFRHVICFRGLMDPSKLAEYKIVASELEQSFSRNGRRTCNLDSGYLDSDKLVLGSFKGATNKLYVGQGVFADIILQYAKGVFTPMPWAFEDFKDGRYDKDLISVREKYKAERKRCRIL